MFRVFKILFGACLLICHFEYSDACFPAKMKHDEAKQGLVKALETDRQVNGEFSIFNEILGEGTTGIVFKGRQLKGAKADVAIKIEDCNPDHRYLIGLDAEYNIYNKLGACVKNQSSFNKHLVGIPTIHYYGKYHKTYKAMVMTLIKNSLAKEFERSHGFSYDTVFMIAVQAIERLEYIHGRGVIVQDVQPANMGHIDDVIYLFDLNMAKEKGSTKFGQAALGTPEYCSLSAARGIIEEKDDMISLGYCLCHMYGQELPWVTDETKRMDASEAFEAMQTIKSETVIENWLNSTRWRHAQIFINYFNYLDHLRSNQKIDYAHLKKLFTEPVTGAPGRPITAEYSNFDWLRKRPSTSVTV